MDHVLFLIHGMGSYPDLTWPTAIAAKLGEVSGRYPSFRARPLTRTVHVEPVLYDGVFRTVLAGWDRDAQQLGDLGQLPPDLVGALTGWLDGASDQEVFFWSHVVDVVLFRFVAQYRDAVIAKVVAQLTGRIAHWRAQGIRRFSIMAHSLGTAVTHESLHWLYTQGPDAVYRPGAFAFENVLMVANVSRVLEQGAPVYASQVRPGGCMRRLLVARHRLDPFTLWRRYVPPASWPETLHVDGLDHYRDVNVHALEHYLDHPRVHIPVLRALVDDGSVGTAEESLAVASYPRYGGRIPDNDVCNHLVARLERWERQHRDRLEDCTAVEAVGRFLDAFVEVLR